MPQPYENETPENPATPKFKVICRYPSTDGVAEPLVEIELDSAFLTREEAREAGTKLIEAAVMLTLP